MKKYEPELLQKINRKIDETQNGSYDFVYVRNPKKLRNGTVTDELSDEFFLCFCCT